MPPEINKTGLPRQRPLRQRRTIYRSIVYSTENLAKTGLVDAEVTGLTEIVEKQTNENRRASSLPRAPFKLEIVSSHNSRIYHSRSSWTSLTDDRSQ